VDFTAFVSPDSIRVMLNAKVEPGVLGDAPDARYQFERTGYFVKDVADWSDERPVFNLTVTLRDSGRR
jgi:glutaminyl-tRNA synthetase